VVASGYQPTDPGGHGGTGGGQGGAAPTNDCPSPTA